jgi:plexin B
MYQYINDNLSIKLFRLIKLLKYQLESGPIDLCLNQAKYCLNENYLLNFDDNSYKKLYINLINQQQVYKTYFILDCDSIKQCKEKFLDYLYKNIASSQRPFVTDIELEFYLAKNQQQLNDILFVDTSSITKVILKEIDDNEPCLDYNGSKYRRYLSIKDYGINDGAYISIQYKQHSELQINTNKFSIKGKLIKNYHLIKPNEAYSSSLTSSASSSSSSSTSAICKKLDDDDNVKLTRLLLIKGTLQPFVDDLFETLFTNTANLSPVIKHLFDYFDQEFRKA